MNPSVDPPSRDELERQIAALQAAQAHLTDELRHTRDALERARELAAVTERRRLADLAAIEHLRVIRWTRAPRRLYATLRKVIGRG